MLVPSRVDKLTIFNLVFEYIEISEGRKALKDVQDEYIAWRKDLKDDIPIGSIDLPRLLEGHGVLSSMSHCISYLYFDKSLGEELSTEPLSGKVVRDLVNRHIPPILVTKVDTAEDLVNFYMAQEDEVWEKGSYYTTPMNWQDPICRCAVGMLHYPIIRDHNNKHMYLIIAAVHLGILDVKVLDTEYIYKLGFKYDELMRHIFGGQQKLIGFNDANDSVLSKYPLLNWESYKTPKQRVLYALFACLYDKDMEIPDKLREYVKAL